MKNTHRAAYLLIELALVLALIAFLASLSLNITGIFYRLQVRADAEKISALLHRCWLQALSNHHTVTLIIDIKGNTLMNQETNELFHLSPGVIFGFRHDALGPPSRPSKPLETPSSFVDNKIIFYADGIVTSGALYLTNERKNTLYAVTIPFPDVFHAFLYVFQGHSWKKL